MLLIRASVSVYKSNPPGTIPLTDSLFIDQYPVKIFDYLEFLSSMRNFYNEALHDSIQKLPKYGLTEADVVGLKSYFKGDSLGYLQMITRTWMTYSNYERKYDIDYHLKSPKYYSYPVVNINYNQMQYYCQWRTDMVILHYATICKNERQRLKYPMYFKYRMINRKEWQLAISKYFNEIKQSETAKKQGDKPNNLVRPYEKEKKRIFYYDVDNAAETLENGVVTFNFKWNSSVRIGNISYFQLEEPSDWITFRCVCQVLASDPMTK